MQPADEIGASGYPLDGFLERHRFGPGVTITAGLILGFIAFQGVSFVVLIGMILSQGSLEQLAALDPSTLVETYASELLIANTVGQFLGLLLFGWVMARLHTSGPLAFLRVRGSDLGLVVLSAVGLIALMPIVQWVGSAMDSLPWPQAIRDFEQVQMDLIEQVLATNLGFVFTLLTMAATPALCEELFFRGYIQRQSERMFSGWVAAIIFTGVVFGLYHLRLTQAIPLSMLGVYMAYVVWRSDSLVPGILVHFLNNGMAVALGAIVSSSDTLSVEDIESLDVPLYILGISAVVLVLVLRAMHRRGHQLATNQRGAAHDIEPNL